jgi:hypothetical protein
VPHLNDSPHNAELLIAGSPVSDGTIGVGEEAWYYYIPTDSPPQTSIGFWAYSADLTFYTEVSVYDGSAGPSDLTDLNGISNPWTGGTNLPMQMALGDATAVYFKVVPQAPGGTLIVDLVDGPEEGASGGEILICDDTPGYPLVILDALDGHARGLVTPFAAGEAGDALATGLVAFYDFDTTSVFVYDSTDWSTVAVVTPTGSGDRLLRTNRQLDRCYVLSHDTGTVKIQYIDNTGALDATVSTGSRTGTVTGLATDPTGQFAYYAQFNGAIRVLSLSDSVQQPDLVAYPGDGSFSWDILVLSNGDLLVMRYRHGITGVVVHRYADNGVELQTYDFGDTWTSPAGSPPRMAYDPAEPDSYFWVFLHPDDPRGYATFQKVTIDTGVVVRDFTRPEFEMGVWDADETLTPDDRFGNSFSCPLVLLQGGPGEGGSDDSDASDVVEPTTGTVTVVKAALAEPSSDTPVFTFTMSPADAFDPNTFTLEPGDSMVFTDVPAGTGYGVSEAPLSGWDLTSTVVNNGSASVNLTVSVGETVTVTFTNAPDVCECCLSTRLQITNQALAKLGHTRFITDLDEATAEGYTAAELWDAALRTSLRHWDWPFATKYAGGADAVDGYMNLIDGSASDPTVADEWVFAYRYPIDCLHARRIVKEGGAGRGFDPEPIPFRVGRTWNGVNDVPLIYCNVEDAVLEYTALVECSEDFFDALFEDALSWRLAGMLAPGLTRTAKTATECMQLFMAVLDMAKAVAAQEAQQEKHGQASWTRDRA